MKSLNLAAEKSASQLTSFFLAFTLRFVENGGIFKICLLLLTVREFILKNVSVKSYLFDVGQKLSIIYFWLFWRNFLLRIHKFSEKRVYDYIN